MTKEETQGAQQFILELNNLIKLKHQDAKNHQNFKKKNNIKDNSTKYEVWYSAIDGDYSKTCDTLEEANNDFAFLLTMYRLVPLFDICLSKINTQGDYKVIKSFKNMKVNNKDIIMAKAYYNSHKGE